MENSRESIRSIVQELMNEVIEQGFHELVNRPQESNQLNQIIHSASEALGEQLQRIDNHNYKTGSDELMSYWQSISRDAQRESLQMLSEIQRIRHQYNPRLKRM
jgi:hypothetical protein